MSNPHVSSDTAAPSLSNLLAAASLQDAITPKNLRSGKVRILIVEDERIVARDLQVRLNGLGYAVTAAVASKAAALDSALKNRPDLVLMDIRLNGVPEGIQAASELRVRFNLPVIYLTGHSDDATLTEARVTEPFGYILKPFENRELAAAIETAIYKHRAETRLRDSNDRLQLAQRAGRVGVFDWNGSTGELFVTPELEEMRDVKIGSIRTIDDLWYSSIDPAELASMRDRFQAWLYSANSEQSWEQRIVAVSGEVRWLQVRALLTRDDEGRPLRIIGTEVDITSRKEMEVALLAKERELERSNADLQAYAYTIAHDLQEPVRTLVCSVELVERGLGFTIDNANERLLFYIKNSAERLRSMIAGLLDYSRLAQEDIDGFQADSNAVLAVVLASLRALLNETQAKITAGPLPVVAISEDRLAQLFLNLISNALKFRKDGVTPEVAISADFSHGFWTFAVADNGIGFDMAYAERIFGVFKRLHARQIEGTGIGLSVCRRIVERAGGVIRAESVIGQGSKFYFSLPAPERVVS